jgi:hypothetical protein
MKINPDKLEELFMIRYEQLAPEHDSGSDFPSEFWVNYCDKHDIFMLHEDWLRDTLNNDGMKGKICIHNCEDDGNASPWLLVPRKFAERALAMGGLP